MMEYYCDLEPILVLGILVVVCLLVQGVLSVLFELVAQDFAFCPANYEVALSTTIVVIPLVVEQVVV